MAMLGFVLVVVHDESIAKWFVRRIISIGTKSFHNLSHCGIELIKNDIRFRWSLDSVFELTLRVCIVFQWVLYTVHETRKYFFH